MLVASHRARVAATLIAAASLVQTAPVRADDDTKTSVIAGLGFTAAAGKTSAANGSGAIEASILSTDAFDQSGAIIASIVRNVTDGRRVVILGHDENPNLTEPDQVLAQIKTVNDRLVPFVMINGALVKPGPGCLKPKPVPSDKKGKSLGTESFIKPLGDDVGPLTFKDLIGASLVDTSVSPIALTAADRMLINAVLMHAGEQKTGDANGWKSPKSSADGTFGEPEFSGTLAGNYVVPGDATLVPAGGRVWNEYAAMLESARQVRTTCTSDAAKAALDDATALVKSLNAPGDKGEPSPLLNAIQLYEVRATNPYVLRLAIEQIGGTMLTRTGIIYSVGLPGAAVVSSGLLVSFRISDPASGKVRALGFVRCMTAPVSLRRARQVAAGSDQGKAAMACTYRASKT